MRKFALEVIPAVLVASLVATAAHAQTTTPQARNRPTTETIQRLQDGRIGAALATLKLTEAQAKLWAPVEAQVRAGQAANLKLMQERIERAGTTAARTALPDRLQMMGDRLAERAERAKAFAAAFAPFYASLTDAQKRVAGHVVSQLQSPPRMGHARMAMRQGAESAGQQPR